MSIQKIMDELNELRDLARTGLPAHGLTPKAWAEYRLAVIARGLDKATNQLEEIIIAGLHKEYYKEYCTDQFECGAWQACQECVFADSCDEWQSANRQGQKEN